MSVALLVIVLINNHRAVARIVASSNQESNLISKNLFHESANELKLNKINKQTSTVSQIKQLQDELANQVKRQKAAEMDHLMMQKWLVDNISDLHRELKQTEVDFEHYVQVTKTIMGNNERQLRQQQQQQQVISPPTLAFLVDPLNSKPQIGTLRALLVNTQTNHWV